MTKKFLGSELLKFLAENSDLTREQQAKEAGYSSIIDLVEAIADANLKNPNYWNKDKD